MRAGRILIAAALAALALPALPAAAQTVSAGAMPDMSGYATKVKMPVPATSAPPAVSDAGATGTTTTQFALANHTHASKARRTIATSAADGSFTYSYAATPFTNPPVCTAVAEVAAGVTDVVNVQIVGTPTTTSASFLVNRTNRSVVSLIGLTVLSVPSQPGATKIHILCIEP